MIHGIDVSHYQGDVDWELVATKTNPPIQFAGIKVTDGVDVRTPGDSIDPMFEKNIIEAKAAGLIPILYHFMRPLHDPKEQLGNFLAQLKSSYFPFCVALDTEASMKDGKDQWDQFTGQEASALALTWLDGAQEALRTYSFIYGDQPFLDSKMAAIPMGIYPPWLARYCKTEPPGWKNSPLWQYAANGQIAGISGPVDLNVFNGEIDDLLAHASKGFAV